MGKYYDGHYEETTLSISDIEKKLIEEKKKSDNLTEWPKDTD